MSSHIATFRRIEQTQGLLKPQYSRIESLSLL